MEIRGRRPPAASSARKHEHEETAYSLGRIRIIDTRVFLAATFLLYASVNVMAPNLTEIARSMHLDEIERDTYLGGFMSTAYFLVGAPASLVVGVLTDIWNRKQLFVMVGLSAAGVIIVSGLAQNIWQMLVLRAVLGALLGGVQPLLFSLFGDLFPPNQRASVSSIVGLTMGGGTLIGQLVAGFIGNTWSWRSPYYIIGILSIFASFLLHIHAVEPERGFADWEEETEGDDDVESGSNKSHPRDSTSRQQQGTHSKSNNANGGEEPYVGISEQECPNTPLSALLPSRSRGGTGASAESVTSFDLSASHAQGLEDSFASRGRVQSEEIDDIPRPRQRQRINQGNDQHQSPGSAYQDDSGTAKSDDNAKGGQDHALSPHSQLDFRTVRRLLSIKTNVFIFLQALPGTIPWGIITVYLHDYFKQEQGFTATQATIIVMTFAVGAVLGGIGGGMMGQRLYNSPNKLWTPLAIGSCQMCACLPVLYLINFQPSNDDPSTVETMSLAFLFGQGKVYTAAALGGLLASATGPNMKAILMNVNTPSTRGSVFTLMYLFDSVGKGVGPAAVAAGVSLLGGRVICFNIAMLGWVASGICMIAIFFTMTADEAEAKARLRANAPK
eukprot:gb/GECG01007521.1/.p1 GENE.gb/GECG01007521.1/~~gb/GECG01007521.1/.p1  ORF type:complete len:614 (+),score=51.05 gb/GECG01007521.1/:1-1842(+)